MLPLSSFTDGTIATGISDWLADLAVKALLLFAAAAIGGLLLAVCRVPASVRHFAWLLAIVGCLALPGLSWLLPRWTIQSPRLATAFAAGQTQGAIEAFNVISVASGDSTDELFRSTEHLGLPPTSIAATPLVARATDEASRQRTIRNVDWRSLACCVWLLGVTIAASPIVFGLLQLRRLRRASSCCSGGQAVWLLEELCQRIGTGRHVELRWTDDRRIPMIWGIRRPVLLLPMDAALWSTDRLRAVLLHELAHVQRFDFVTQLLAQLARALYWYNPLAWLAVSRLRRDQEQACDDRVLRTGYNAVDYAEHLLAIVTRSARGVCTPAVALAMARTSCVERRLTAILDSRRDRGTLRPAMAALLSGVMMILALPLAAADVEVDKQNKPTVVKQVEKQAVNQAGETPADKQANDKRLTERVLRLRQALAEHYVTPPDDQQVLNGAIQGMLGSLADPYTEFLPADKLPDLQRDIDGKLTGIGAQLEVRFGEIAVVTPLEGSPALAAGIRPGDAILEIDGQSTSALELSAAVKKIVGEVGTVVKLKVRRADGKTEELAITRGPIVLRAVRGFYRSENGDWQYMLSAEHKIGYAAVDQFTTAAAQELRTAVERLQAGGLKGMILDLRSSPGGLLSSAIESAELLLPEATIVSLRGRESGEHIWKSDGRKQIGDFPLVVLIDQRTASAAEVLAGALQDNDRAVLLGTRTFGKGSVQTLIPLQDAEGAIRLTTAYYYLPSGRNIDRKPGKTSWGIDPTDGYFLPVSNKVVEARGQLQQQRALLGQFPSKPLDDLTPETIEKSWRDPQLAAAMETLLAKLSTGEFKKVGQSVEIAAKYAVSLDEVERRRGEALKKLHQLDEELKRIEQQADKQP